MSTGDPAEVAALFELAASENAVYEQLQDCVARIGAVQQAKRTLARLPVADLRAGLLVRHDRKLRP